MRSSPASYDQGGNPRSVAGRAGRQLVAFLRPGDTSWVVPKTSRYTIYAFGPGGGTSGPGTARAGGGALAIARSRPLTAGTILTASIGRGGYYQDGTTSSPTGPTTLTGGGLNLSAGAGLNFDGTFSAIATGGDANFNGVAPGNTGSAGAAGSDGSLFGSGGLSVTGSYALGVHPGGGGSGGNSSANGEIRIVDETP